MKKALVAIIGLLSLLGVALAGTVALRDFSEHRDTANKYSIQYPSSWEKMPSDFIAIAKKQLPDRDILLALWSTDRYLSLSVAIEKVPSEARGFTLKELFNRMLAISMISRQTISQEELKIQGVTAIKVVSSASTPNGLPAKYIHLFLIRKGTAWIIGIGGQPASFDNNRNQIDAVLSSLKFAS